MSREFLKPECFTRSSIYNYLFSILNYTDGMKFHSTQVSILRITTHLFSLAFMIPAARLLGPSTLGKVAVVVTLIPIFSDLIDFGAGTFVSRAIANNKFSNKDLKLYLKSKFKICILLIFPWAMISWLLGVDWIMIFPLVVFLLFSNILNLFNNSMQQIAIAQGRSGSAAAGMLIERVGWSFFALFIFIGLNSLAAFSSATILGYFAQSTYLYFSVLRRITNFTESQESSVEIRFKNYSNIGVKTLISNLYLYNQIIVTSIAGATEGGVFSVAYRLRNLLIVGYTSVSWSITNDLLLRNTPSEFKKTLLKNRLTLILNTLGILVLFVFAEQIFNLVFGLQYEKSVMVFRLLCVSQILSIFQILITTYLMCGYHEKTLRKMVSTVVPITLTFEGIGAFLDGATGAAVGTLISSFFTSIVYIYSFRKWSYRKVPLK